MWVVVALASAVASGMFALPAEAAGTQGQAHKATQGGKPETQAKPGPVKHPANTKAIAINADDHRKVVREYFTRESLPPGLAKRESLPPGLAKQLRENGALPPGLEKHRTAVPPALATRLPAVPPYYTRYFAGRDLLVVDTRTNTLAAIIRDILK